MLSRRIIPCLDVRDGQVVKGLRFRDHVVRRPNRRPGPALPRRRRRRTGVLRHHRQPGRANGGSDLGRARRALIDIPFCVAGGIRSVADARRSCSNAGADKISVNSPALERPALVADIGRCLRRAMRGGRHRQPARCRRRVAGPAVHRRSRQDPLAAAPHPRLGGGGAGAGRWRDRGQLHGRRWRALRVRPRQLRPSGSLPGAAGRLRVAPAGPRILPPPSSRPMSMRALAAGVFHSGELPIPVLKGYLREQRIEVRDVA